MTLHHFKAVRDIHHVVFPNRFHITGRPFFAGSLSQLKPASFAGAQPSSQLLSHMRQKFVMQIKT